MKKLVLYLIFFSSFFVFSQQPNFNYYNESENVQFNQLSIPVNRYCFWHHIEWGNVTQVQVSIDSINPIYSYRDMIFGKNAQNGILRGAWDYSSFYQDSLGNVELVPYSGHFRMGPYSPNSATEEANWRKIWHLTKWDIDHHVAQYSATGYSMHPDIESWPAHGDTTLGESFNLAPFYDFNNNGFYDPENGDYPLIKGDVCLYSIFNDVERGTDNVELGQQLNIEVHKMVYSLNCVQDSALNYTVFTDYRIINKGAHPIEDIVCGQSFDFDIGFHQDDYFGTNVMLGLTYIYNSTSNFANNNTPPAQGCAVLKGFKRMDDGIDNAITHQIPASYNGIGFNDGIIDNEYYGLYASMYKPTISAPFVQYPDALVRGWRLLNGIWYEGTPMVYGGLGHPSHSPTMYQTKYALPGDSDPNHYGTNSIDPGFNWSEPESNLLAGDRRGFMSTKGDILAPNEEQTITNMIVYARDRQNVGPIASVSKLEDFTQDIRNYFIANQTPCGGTFDYYQGHQFLGNEEQFMEDLIQVYPNPSQSQVYISGLEDLVDLTIYNLQGQEIKRIRNFSDNSIGLSLFENGVYLIQFEMDGYNITKKIVKH